MKSRISFAALACSALCASLSAQSQTNPTTPATGLPETTVTATRFAEDGAALPLGVSVVTAEQIRASGAATVNEALMRILGVVGRQDLYGGGDYSLDLRGFGTTADSNQVIVLDGVRLSEADIGGTRIAGIAIDTVERIEVLRGNAAVLYGEGATGGAIVITTKAGMGKDRKNSASVYTAVGSNQLREVRGSATLAGGGFSVDVSGSKRDSDNHRDNFKSGSDASAITGQWSNDTVRIGVRHSSDLLDAGMPGALSAAQYAANPRQAPNPTDRVHITNSRSGVFGEVLVGGWQIASEAGSRDKSLRSFQAFNYAYDVKASSYDLRARNETQWGSVKNTFVAGTEYNSWTRQVLGAFGNIGDQDSRAWYLKDDVSLATGTRLSAGYRTESLHKVLSGSSALDGQLHAWDLGLSQAVGGGATVYGRVGTSYRLANVDEFSFTDPSIVIRPQTSRDTELGARWAGGPFRLEARAYRSALTDEIGYDPAGNGPFGAGTGANMNFDPTRRQGFELDGAWALMPRLNLRANVALRKATFQSGPYAGKDVPLVPRRAVALRADWTPVDGHRVTGGVNWVSSQHPDLANQCSMPAYTTADLRYAYQWQNVELSLGVANIADRKYYTQAFGCAAGGVTTSIYPEAGRTFTAAMRVNF